MDKSDILDINNGGEHCIHDPVHSGTDPRARPEWYTDDLLLEVGTAPYPSSTENNEFKNVLTASSTL